MSKARDELQEKVRDSICFAVNGQMSKVVFVAGTRPQVAVNQILSQVDTYVNWVIGEDVKHDLYCQYKVADCLCGADCANLRLAEQRQQAGLQAKKGEANT